MSTVSAVAKIPEAKRCLFLACSGVRVKNDELRSIGVTLPGFVERGRTIASLPSLGLLTIASFCPKDWHLEYRETDDSNPFDAKAYEGFDIVAISSLSAQINQAYQISDFIRSLGIVTVMGGLHVSALPDEAQAHTDVVVVGEGEYTWQQFCLDFEKGEYKSRYLASDFGPFDFKDARIPRYDLLDMSKYNRITVQTQRGCPRACTFCASSHTISNYKCKPVKQVVAEIEEISKYWPHPFIEFADDNTFLNREWSKDLLDAIEPFKIRWFTETDISVAKDDVLLEKISKSGCYQILIGLESASAHALTAADPYKWKSRQYDIYKSAIDKIQGFGISVNGCFILGWDHDTLATFDRTIEYVRELGLAEVQVTLLTPFPNTVLYKELKNQGRLLSEKFWDSCTLFDLNFIPKNMTVQELEDGILRVFTELYNAKSTHERKQIFRKCVRAKRELQRRLKLQTQTPSQIEVNLDKTLSFEGAAE